MSRYSCRYCWKFFSDEKSLNIHLYESHKYCKKCKQDFEDRSKILKHLEEKHKLNLICRDCNFTSFDETAVKIHVRHVHGKISISLQNPNVEKRFVSDRKSKKRCFDFSNYLAETETAISEESEEIVKNNQVVNINKKYDTNLIHIFRFDPGDNATVQVFEGLKVQAIAKLEISWRQAVQVVLPRKE